MNKYNVLGTHYSNAKSFFYQKQGFFFGEIFLAEDGNFEGTMEDSFGNSVLDGKMESKSLSFEKIYIDGVLKGQKVKYELLRREEGVGYIGQWKNSGMSGNAVCALFRIC
jgi:hypothetical protein